jgi:hypothetical protein
MRRIVSRAVSSLFLWALPLAVAFSQGKIEYNRDIRPILSENCFACHGPDSAARKADLRLDRREMAMESTAIVPFKPEESELIARIEAADPDRLMPPPKSLKTLTQAQKKLLKQWIAEGAEYQNHWSFIPPVKPPLPAVKDEAWVRNPIDRFILSKLEERGLKPAPEADRALLARRVSLDLTGLPPEPALLDAFMNDTASDAYERLVDHLLRSTAWGEHRAKYWLDAARYADSHGIHFDNYREIWAYRDWVIGAFNRNMPFDQFTIEQLAGDLLPDRTLDQQIASGFNRCNITTNEGGVIPEEYLVHYTRDRTETTAQVWMGLTANCAVCHDHKFDPLTQREFYEMASFFNNTTQQAMDGNIKDTPPIVPVPRAEDRPRFDALAQEIPAARQAVEARRSVGKNEFEAWLASKPGEGLASRIPEEGLAFHARLDEGQGNVIKAAVAGQSREVTASGPLVWEAGSVAAQAYKCRPESVLAIDDAADFEKDQAFTAAAWVKIPNANATGAIVARMDNAQGYRGWDLWLENGRVGMHIIHKWQEDALKVASKAPIEPGKWTHVLVSYDGSAKAAGIKVYVNGQPRETAPQADALKNSSRTTVPLKIGQRHSSERLNDAAIQDVRIYRRALGPQEASQLAQSTRAAYLATRAVDQQTEADRAELFSWWLTNFDEVYRELAGKLAGLEQEKASLAARGTIAHVMQERAEPAMAYILYRGEYDKRRDQVVPKTPAILPPMPQELPRNRLGFARWILLPDQPLTARVTVNRFWQEVFGAGIVKTSGDFGIAGELPSHPELLDWLAIEFRESGWNVKQFFKLLVTSAAYRQAAVATPEKIEKDAQNRLLSRGPRFRMEAEMIRDFALASSGLLVNKLGGPSVKPYQPDGVWEAVAMIGSNTRDYVRDTGENLYRRSLYTFWKRSAPPALMEIFNAPAREVCTVRRERTNTPLQALATMNDPTFVEAARHLAQRALLEGGAGSDERVDFLSRRFLCRRFAEDERRVVNASLQRLQQYYAAHPEQAKLVISVGESKADARVDAAQLAAWTMLANELMNLDEALNK